MQKYKKMGKSCPFYKKNCIFAAKKQIIDIK